MKILQDDLQQLEDQYHTEICRQQMAETHCELAKQEIETLKTKLNRKEEKAAGRKGMQLPGGASFLMSRDAMELWEQQKQERREKEQAEDEKQAAKAAFRIFKENPFDPRLRTHKIHKLSAAHGKTIYSVWIEADLRAVFYLEGSTVWSIDIGTHAIYRS